MHEAVQTASKQEFRMDSIVNDIADLVTWHEIVANPENSKRLTIYTFGGLIGEIILVFTACQDYIQSQPSSIGHKFTSDQFETFISSLMDRDVGKINLAVNAKFETMLDYNDNEIILDLQE